jgi:hypothetical protein
MRVAPGQTLVAALKCVSVRDLDTRFSLRVGRLAGGTGSAAWLAARRTTTGNEYRLVVRISPAGVVYLRGFRRAGGVTRVLATEVRTKVRVAAGQRLWVRVRVVGTAPTRFAVKVWRAGVAEPTGWQYKDTDTSTALSRSGSIALRASVSSRSGGGAVRFTFDNWRVTAP